MVSCGGLRGKAILRRITGGVWQETTHETA
jgi:hypothetical protein